MSCYRIPSLAAIAFAAAFTGCSSDRFEPAPPAPATVPVSAPLRDSVSGTKIFFTPLTLQMEALQLGPNATQLFLKMLKTKPVHSQISQMTAAPMGIFTIGDKEYQWHGNGVTLGGGREERLWSGPYLQRLINAVMKGPCNTPEDMALILSILEADLQLGNTPMEGPGAYPGGGDALNPMGVRGP